jgi:hypothetical protein
MLLNLPLNISLRILLHKVLNLPLRISLRRLQFASGFVSVAL